MADVSTDLSEENLQYDKIYEDSDTSEYSDNDNEECETLEEDDTQATNEDTAKDRYFESNFESQQMQMAKVEAGLVEHADKGTGVKLQLQTQPKTTGHPNYGFGKRWSKSEDVLLKSLVEKHGESWNIIGIHFKDRLEQQVQQRWAKVLNPELIKGPWTRDEDEKVIELVRRFGPKKWTLIARYLNGRIGMEIKKELESSSIETPHKSIVGLRTPTPFKNALAAIGKKRDGRSYVPSSPSSLVEDLAEIINEEQMTDSQINSSKDERVFAGIKTC
ncbi:hypothetical protein ACLKA7_000991 [Drosophila subpalustris]